MLHWLQTPLQRFGRSGKLSKQKSITRGQRFSHDAASPELFAQPVTHCRCMPMHVLTRVNTDPSDGRALNFKRKIEFPAVRLWLAAGIRARLGSCMEAGKDRVALARLCDCSRA